MLLSILYRKENYNSEKLSKLNKVAKPLEARMQNQICIPQSLLSTALSKGSYMTRTSITILRARVYMDGSGGSVFTRQHNAPSGESSSRQIQRDALVFHHFSAFLRSQDLFLYPLLELSSPSAEMDSFLIPLITVSIKSLL